MVSIWMGPFENAARPGGFFSVYSRDRWPDEFAVIVYHPDKGAADRWEEWRNKQAFT